MTQPYVPEITFVLGPPRDPELLAAYQNAQEWSDPGKDFLQFCHGLEPRLASLLAARNGELSVLSRLVSIVLDAPVRVRDVRTGFMGTPGRLCARFQIRANRVEGPPKALARLFEKEEPAHYLAESLAHVLKLEWVQSLRSIPVAREDVR